MRLVEIVDSDVNDPIPSSLINSFDFAWSLHTGLLFLNAKPLVLIGSVGLGQRFILDSLAALKPGGVAVHFVDITLSSLTDTYEVCIAHNIYL